MQQLKLTRWIDLCLFALMLSSDDDDDVANACLWLVTWEWIGAAAGAFEHTHECPAADASLTFQVSYACAFMLALMHQVLYHVIYYNKKKCCLPYVRIPSAYS